MCWSLEPPAEYDSKLLRYAIRVAVVPCGVPSSYANEARRMSQRKQRHGACSPLERRLGFRSPRRTRQQATNAINHPGKDVPGWTGVGSCANEASGKPKVSQRKLRHSLRSPLDHRLELKKLPPTDSKPPMKSPWVTGPVFQVWWLCKRG